MADTKLADMIPATALTGTELLYCVQGGVDSRTTVQDVADAAFDGTMLASLPAAATPLNGTELVYVIDKNGIDAKLTLAQLKTYVLT